MNYQFSNQIKRKHVNGQAAAVIRYNEDTGQAPSVVAQGKGDVAKQIISLAQQHDIPLQEDHRLIGELLDMDLGESIPPQLYAVMAEILLLVEELEKKY
ncbi:EscU/YscU/HrcU family type III secretion system export apparatus switch protein [Fictibacillus sp. b24]|uniref:EscU/YscU/HrcU family type III secretion system export apparatus switch protein n=1 Tax=Fictibacillus sp. b24 TaxID=3055863 RepID=UPI0025A0F49A|nr:EscU/YscU/HrcU family type III secretion system export apparatus switch protein [Fictibacillus sp. b24]MDM5315084.1 EscU/YscU/HrcU family type III secretion system export apparatus switch protein [Fictibacillus sp. b24]